MTLISIPASADIVDLELIAPDTTSHDMFIIASILLFVGAAMLLLSSPHDSEGILAMLAGVCLIGAGIAISVVSSTNISSQSEKNTDERNHAQSLILSSLNDKYDVTAIKPVDPVEDFDQGEWLVTAFANDSFEPAAADVELADGTIVTWGVIADPKTGQASFVMRAESNTSLITPADVER